MSNSVTRYSDAELAEFKEVIEKRMAKTKESLDGLQTQILEITENTSESEYENEISLLSAHNVTFTAL